MFNCFHELSQLNSFEFREKSMNLSLTMLFILIVPKTSHSGTTHTIVAENGVERRWVHLWAFNPFLSDNGRDNGPNTTKKGALHFGIVERGVAGLRNGTFLSWFIKWSISCASYFYGFRCHTHTSGVSVKMKTLNELTITKMNSLNKISFEIHVNLGF